jgi:uncharacterized protein (DUF1778 family)
MRTGRPKKKPDEVQSKRIDIRLTADERKRFEAAAKSADLPLSEWLRRAAERAIAKRKA